MFGKYPVIFALLATHAVLSAATPKKTRGPVFGSATPNPGALRGAVYRLPKGTDALPNFATLKPVGILYTTRLDYWLQNYGDEWFGIEYTGRFYVTAPGDYYFQLTVDDGGEVIIDGKGVLYIDGIHPVRTEGRPARLKVGWHEIRVSYFQGPLPYIALVLEVEPPKGKRRVFDVIDFQPPPDAFSEESRPTLRRKWILPGRIAFTRYFRMTSSGKWLERLDADRREGRFPSTTDEHIKS